MSAKRNFLLLVASQLVLFVFFNQLYSIMHNTRPLVPLVPPLASFVASGGARQGHIDEPKRAAEPTKPPPASSTIASQSLSNININSSKVEADERVFASNTWILNFNISHYSSNIIVDSGNNNTSTDNGDVQVVTLAFIERYIEHAGMLQHRLRCVIRVPREGNDPDLPRTRLIVKKPVEIYEINYKPMQQGPKSLWRVKCNVSRAEHRGEVRSIRVALIDKRFIAHWLDAFRVREMRDALLFHEPRLVERVEPRKPQVAHCLHKVIDLTEERMRMLTSWLDMQRGIGIAQVRMCMFDWPLEYVSQLRAEYGQFVELVNHETKLHDICRWQLRMGESHPYTRAYRLLRHNCKQHIDLLPLHSNILKYAFCILSVAIIVSNIP